MAINKKTGLGVLALIIAIAIILLLIWLPNLPKSSNILLNDGAIIPDAKCQNLDKVIVIYSKSCPHCTVALPLLQELEQELNTNFTYYVIDNDQEKIISLGLLPEAVPTLIAKCKVYVGARSKDEYRAAIE
jgi:thiol-disulfide isomerase/thioredoxin